MKNYIKFYQISIYRSLKSEEQKEWLHYTEQNSIYPCLLWHFMRISPMLLAFWVGHVYCLLILQCREWWLSLSIFPCVVLRVLVLTNMQCLPWATHHFSFFFSFLSYPGVRCILKWGSHVFSRTLSGSTWSALFPFICERQTWTQVGPQSPRAECIC